MFLVRDIMFCKPGKVSAMVEKFKALGKLTHKMGMGSMRVMTDVSGERFWTVIAESEVENLDTYMTKSRESMKDADFQAAMKGYHDLIDGGRREIYTIES